MKWVLDASVAIRWLLLSEADERAKHVLARLIDDPITFAVPELFPFEVFAVLCRVHAQPMQTFREGIVPLLHGGMYRQPMTERLAVAAGEYISAGLTGYDACYASLARDLGATWLTFDGRAHHLITLQESLTASLTACRPLVEACGRWPGVGRHIGRWTSPCLSPPRPVSAMIRPP